jgi:hypothetical protein
MNIEFNGKIWFWHGPAPWYFVTIPAKQCRDLGLEPVMMFGPSPEQVPAMKQRIQQGQRLERRIQFHHGIQERRLFPQPDRVGLVDRGRRHDVAQPAQRGRRLTQRLQRVAQVTPQRDVRPVPS